MADLTKEELIALGQKFAARKELDSKRTKAVAEAVGVLKATHKPEFDKLYKEALKKAGL